MSTDLQRFIGGFAVLAAALLVLFAARNLPARLMALSGDDLRDQVMAGADASDADFAAFVKAREDAVAWHAYAEYLDELAAVRLARVGGKDMPDQDADRLLRRAAEDQAQALRIEPADTYGWSEMAFLDMQDGLHDAKAAADLRLSVESAPYEPALLASRLDMMLGLRDAVDMDLRRDIPALARAAWQADPQTVAANAARHHYISVIENALAADPDATAKFHSLLPTLTP